MATRYWLNISTISGTPVAQVAQLSDNNADAGFQYLVATKKRNDVGILRTIISQSIPQAEPFDDLEDGEMLMAELYRFEPALGSNPGIPRYVEWRGFVRPKRRYAEGKRLLMEIEGVHENVLLEWRRIMWPANLANRSVFSNIPAETIAKTLVRYNATSDATTGNGRATNGEYTAFPITIETDSAAGTSLSMGVAWLNLLPALQRVATLGNGDFSLEYAGDSVSWEFQWHTPYLGQDRSAEVVFSLDRGNMQDPVLTMSNLWEPTVAVVAGQGQGEDRTLVVRTGDNYNSSFDREVFVDARDLSTTNALEDRGDERLNELKSRNVLDFTPKQTDSQRYGRNYFLGDLVAWRFSGLSGTQQIDSVEIELSDGKVEEVKIGLRDV